MDDRQILDIFYIGKSKRLRRDYQNIIDNNADIYDYIINRYNDSSSFKETLYRIKYKIDTRTYCKVCGKPTEFLGLPNRAYRDYCSVECKCKENGAKVKKTKLERYGASNYVNIDKCRQTCLERYGHVTGYNHERCKETKLKKYGDANFVNIEKMKQTKLEKYGDEFFTNSEKTKQTCLERYGVTSYLATKESRELRKSPEAKMREYNTKRQNGTLGQHISKNEQYLYNLIITKYPNAISQYFSDKYNFKCDIYIPELNTYIEYNEFWTHGEHPYDEANPNDINKLEFWKNQNTEFYNNAIYTWTNLDVRKRQVAKDNNLNFVELWNANDIHKFINSLDINITTDISLPFDYNRILGEFNYYKESKGKLSGTYTTSYIIKYFQQDIFYKKEKELYKDDTIRTKLITNRMKYLNKEYKELTTLDLLDGFKRSMIYYGYSHFNPLWFKWFIKKYNIKSCYDPCGGWGHRLLGAQSLDKYIYNDLSKSVYDNVNRIIDYFNIENCITYNADANTFRPSEEYDAMFTCPPYYNTESYECGDFDSIESYYKLIDNLFDCFYNSNAKIFGLIIREDCLEDKWKQLANESIELKIRAANHIHNSKKYKEYLFIFTKA